MRKIIEIVFNPVPGKKVLILKRVISLMRQGGMRMDSWVAESGVVDADRYLSAKEQVDDWRYGFETDEIQVIHGETGALGFYHLLIREKRSGSIRSDWGWVIGFSELPGFLGARVADYDYEYWQNADSVVEYESSGRSYDLAMLISNGLPYPLEEKVIDVSVNPGRRMFKSGYVEAIGYEMWLSDRFFLLIGGYSAERLRAAGWSVDERENGFKHLSVSPQDLSETGSAEKQKILRAALFE